MRAATVALVVRYDKDTPSLVDILSDDREIGLFEASIADRPGESGDDPLQTIYEHRTKQAKEEEEFGNYVEDLLSQPFVRPEIQEHGIQWLKSKIRIEQYQRSEWEAAKIIADYAFRVFQEDPARTDFFLSGPSTKVRIKVFVMRVSEGKPRTKSDGKTKAA